MVTDGFARSCPPLTLSSPTDLIAAVPYLLGFHPDNSLVLLGVDTAEMRARFTGRCDLARPGGDPQPAAAWLTAPLRREGCDGALIAAFGSPDRTDPMVAQVGRFLDDDGIELREALRVDQGRYWSYLCPAPAYLPDDGMPYNTDSSPVPAAAVAAGLTAYPSRAALAATIAPVRGEARLRMRAATQRAEARCVQYYAERSDQERPAVTRALRREGARHVHSVLAHALTGEQLIPPDDLAWLGLMLMSLRVRDEAWVRIDHESAHAHVRLWGHVLRHVEPDYVPAPGALLAFSAWLTGDGALANLALDRVEEVEPTYSMAGLLRQLITQAVPPHRWSGFSPEELEEESPIDEVECGRIDGPWERGGSGGPWELGGPGGNGRGG